MGGYGGNVSGTQTSCERSDGGSAVQTHRHTLACMYVTTGVGLGDDMSNRAEISWGYECYKSKRVCDTLRNSVNDKSEHFPNPNLPSFQLPP